MRNCGSLPQPCAVLPLHFYVSDPPSNQHPVPILYLLIKIFSFPSFSCHFLPSQLFVIYLQYSLFFTLSLFPCPILNRPTVFHSLTTTTTPIPPHSLPTKFLSLRGWDEGVLNLKSLVRTLTGTGHSRCCSHQAGHSSAQAGTPLVLQKRGGRKGWGRLV